MRDNKVSAVTLDEWLGNLRLREWLIPQFQRDFVWGIAEVGNFARSVLEGRPIGMVTVWEQPDDSELELEPISLSIGGRVTEFASSPTRPSRYFAVLDGRQRSQAVAMAFGGLRVPDRRSKHSGRFFLDASETEDAPKVVYLPQSILDKRHLNDDRSFIAAGLVPLSSDDPEENSVSRWVRYITLLNEASTYGGTLPEPEILAARKKVVQDAFDGLTRSRLAVYTVPSRYQLGEICEIFETLNTTGTRVSTTDLIHSFLFAETHSQLNPMLLREWIADMGDIDGSAGWASAKDRPELFVQIVAGCYLALDRPPAPRKGTRKLASIKASDLLALPTSHWLAVRERSDSLARILLDFQHVVGDGHSAFGFADCPYPVLAGLYAGLRWKLETEPHISERWGTEQLDSLFRAFFWQNALRNRYDQGFLTKFVADMRFLLDLLDEYAMSSTFQAWVELAEERLNAHMGGPGPDLEVISGWAQDGSISGALLRALSLPQRCRVKADLLHPDQDITYPESAVDLHHIFPKQWCKDNSTGSFGSALARNKDRDPVSGIANLMPLGRTSNQVWKTSNPGTIIDRYELTYQNRREILRSAFISEEAFAHLQRGVDGVIPFWEARARLIAQDLAERMRVRLL